jgi:hypothetical protein
MAYLYRHIRLDKNEPFYIGIGGDEEGKYERAYNKNHRTNYWKYIANKTKYRVEIILDDLNWSDACKKEIEFIRLYKRKDSKNGILVNMTDGGDGANGVIRSKETCLKISESHKGNKHPMYGAKRPGELAGNYGKTKGKYILIDNNHNKIEFEGIKQLMCYGVNETTIRKWINKGIIQKDPKCNKPYMWEGFEIKFIIK